MTATKYRATVRLTLASGRVIEPGGLVKAPEQWLIDQGLVEPVEGES